ncbi:MAG: hypothetical protein IAC42_09470 [Spirochaetes bacterium]|uniref:Uncharacterized protein n=1 Tax=Candidatus Aphodenecus pullistercoris TaxID=2840669 RepID=A0A9D9EBX1_9SPIR|nr:hypothetical protein [Candidatus Aphodenecus pullistercoris]
MLRKTFLSILVLVMIVGFCFASQNPSSIVIKGKVEEGGGIKPPDENIPSITDGAIQTFVYYDIEGAAGISGNSEGLNGLSDAATTLDGISFDLTGLKGDPDALYLYLICGVNAGSEGSSATITFSSEKGWEYKEDLGDRKAQAIPLVFTNKGAFSDEGMFTVEPTSSNASEGVTKSSIEIVLNAATDAQFQPMIVSKTKVSWEQDAYYVGEYEATITIHVDGGQ